MSLSLNDPQQEAERVISFLQHTYQQQGKSHAVVAVSGGIDSGLSLTLVTQALGAANVTPVFLPYGQQSVEDSQALARFNMIPESNWVEHNIKLLVDQATNQLKISDADKVRRGNVMARMRMIVLYDVARQVDGLVCGTENKSEQHLGYFTRFGDEASDVEPIQHLYKTQVRQLAQFLGMPEQIIAKAPSAGLWADQTDEEELGFTYEEADKALEQVGGVDPLVVQKVMAQVAKNSFKHEVPYTLEDSHD
jgi:NAD+ synthase